MKLSAYASFLKTLILSRKQIITDHVQSIYEIDFDSLEEGHQLIIFDHDDTLTDHLGTVNDKTQKLLHALHDRGFNLSVFSNCSKKQTNRLKSTFDNSGIYVVTRSDKPAKDGFVEVMDHFNVPSEKTIMVGDRIGTDMYGAYAANIHARILVDNYSLVFGGNRPNLFLKFFGKLERILYFATRR